ncbi:MAG: metal ABC transporter substrate-binding protein [Chloroflexota bacterium]
MRRRLWALVAVAAVVAACSGGGAAASPSDGRIEVVTTTTVFADLVRSIGGDRVVVDSLVPKGGDVHTFDPRPSDARRIDDAGLVIANGLGLDDWLAKLAKDTGTAARIVQLADSVPADRYIVEGGIANPHLWLDPDAASAYGGAIAAALAQVDPDHAATYQANRTAFDGKLRDLKAWGRSLVGTIPPGHRSLISFHDALPYFARAFGLEIAGVIVKAPGQDPSASDIAALVDAIRASGVRVVVSEAQFSDKLARTVAEETGATIVTDIHDDSLGDPPVDTYLGLIRYDLDRLVAALNGSD